MSEFGDRLLLSLIVVTVGAALFGVLVGNDIIRFPHWFTTNWLPVVAAVVLVAFAVAAWEWFDLID